MEERIRLVEPSYSEKTYQKVRAVLESGQLVQGSVVEKMEQIFCDYLGCKYSLLVSSGTTALQLAINSSKIGSGDEVIVPAFSYVASAHVVEVTGAKPVFVDVKLDDFNIDVSKIEKSISSRTKAILVVHEFGMPANIEEINRIAEKYNLNIIEDAACAIGSSFKDKKIGNGNNIACFSFHPRKVITSGEGGLITTNNEEDYKYLKTYRSHGWNENGQLESIGLNYRMTEFQAAMLSEQLENLNKTIEMRNEIASFYNRCILNPLMGVPKAKSICISNWQSYHILCSNKRIRDHTINQLRANHIDASYGAQCIPEMEYYKKKYGASLQEHLKAMKAFECGLVIPNHENLTKEECQRIVDVLNDIKK